MLYRTLLVEQNVLFACQLNDCIVKIFCPLRHAAEILCQLLRHGDHWRRSLPCMERRHYPRIPWKRKSFIPGKVKTLFCFAEQFLQKWDCFQEMPSNDCDSTSWATYTVKVKCRKTFIIFFFPPVFSYIRSTSGSPGWRRRRRRSRRKKQTKKPEAEASWCRRSTSSYYYSRLSFIKLHA